MHSETIKKDKNVYCSSYKVPVILVRL